MLRKFFVVGALLGGIALLPTVANAQPKQGDWELTLGGAGSNNQDFDAGSATVNLGLGVFATDWLEIVLRQSVGYNDPGTGTFWTGSTAIAADIHFDMDRFQPFIGVAFGYAYGDQPDTFFAGPEAGVKVYVNPRTFVFLSVQYQFFFEDADDADDAFEDGAFVYGLGIGFNF